MNPLTKEEVSQIATLLAIAGKSMPVESYHQGAHDILRLTQRLQEQLQAPEEKETKDE